MKWPIGYLVRSIIENIFALNDTKNLLETSQLISPCYITLYVHNQQSYIITRDCDKTVNTRSDNLVQTNCDWNKTKPNILWSLERIKFIKSVQEKINAQEACGNYNPTAKDILALLIDIWKIMFNHLDFQLILCVISKKQ